MSAAKMTFAAAILISCVVYSVGKVVRIDCPGNCLCDTVQNLRRVRCVQRNLISVEAAIPSQTDILDLSDNYISTLDEDEFRLVHLDGVKSLNISHNKLSTVHYYAFRGMGKLKILDLSRNAITYIHSQWFVDMSSLKTVSLHHNNFFDLQYDVVPSAFNSKTLQHLNLANSNMAYIDPEFFAELPALERLDLSSNSLIQLDIKAITSIPMLQELNIDGNDISCNKDISTYCTSNGIHLIGDACLRTKTIKKKGNRLEKMIAAPELEVASVSNDINGWLLEDFEVEDRDYISNSNCSTADSKSSTFMDFYSLSPIFSLACALIVGLVFGVAIGMIVIYSCTQTRHLITADAVAKRRLQRRRRFPSILPLHRLSSLGGTSHSSIQFGPQSPIVSYEQYNSESTPITPRKTYDN